VADQILSRDFDKDVRPPGRPNPEDAVKIKASMHIMELNLCKHHQELTVGGYFRQKWNDPRLAYDFGDDSNGESRITMKYYKIILSGKVIIISHPRFRDMFEDRQIWIPDTFLVEDREGFVHKAGPETGARSFSQVKCCGGVLASFKLRTKSSCSFPEDAQNVECTLSFESCKRNTTNALQ